MSNQKIVNLAGSGLGSDVSHFCLWNCVWNDNLLFNFNFFSNIKKIIDEGFVSNFNYLSRPLKSDDSIDKIWVADTSKYMELPFFDTKVQAGFPSPAEDHLEQRLDLNSLVIENPSATFFVRVAGESMKDAGINDGDILVVDRSIENWENRIVVAVIDSEFTIKRFTHQNESVVLKPENPDYPSIKIASETDFSVWGVVCWTLKKL